MQWYQLDHMQTICTSLQTGNYINTSSLNFTGQMLFLPKVPKQWRETWTENTTFILFSLLFSVRVGSDSLTCWLKTLRKRRIVSEPTDCRRLSAATDNIDCWHFATNTKRSECSQTGSVISTNRRHIVFFVLFLKFNICLYCKCGCCF